MDLGNVDQALWNTAQGRLLQFTLMAPIQSRLALHVEPILLLFVPFYWLTVGGPELLLAIQAVIVALGAWPLYRVANYRLNPISRLSWSHLSIRPQTCSCLEIDSSRLQRHLSHAAQRTFFILPFALLVFPLAYLLLPTLESAVLFDFHAVTLAPTFLLFAFWALEQRNDRQFFLFALSAVACKEDMPLLIAMLGAYAGLVHHRWRLGGLTIVVSLTCRHNHCADLRHFAEHPVIGISRIEFGFFVASIPLFPEFDREHEL